MAFALVGTIGVASQGVASAAVTPAWGTSENRTVGNLLVCFVSVTGSVTAPTTPSGWTAPFGSFGGTNCSATILIKTATGTDAAPTIAAITSGVIAAQLAEFSGGNVVDRGGGLGGTTSPLNSGQNLQDTSVGELLLIASADFRSTARTPNDTLTSNNATVTQAGNNNGVSSVNHYSFGYSLSTTSNASTTSVILTCSVTTSITGLVIASATIKLAPLPVLPDLFQQPLTPPGYERIWT